MHETVTLNGKPRRFYVVDNDTTHHAGAIYGYVRSKRAPFAGRLYAHLYVRGDGFHLQTLGTDRCRMCGANHRVRKGATEMKHEYEVICGNIGTVYSGDSFSEARKKFRAYRKLSQSGYGRAAGEAVTLLKDGHINEEHQGRDE